MKIAVAYENGNIFQHFGHTKEFKIYETENNVIKSETIVSAEGHGHGALAGFLLSESADILICGGIGEGAKNALKSAGITLYGGVCGNADEAVKAFLSGKLQFNPDITCSHHGEHEHSCGGSCENKCSHN